MDAQELKTLLTQAAAQIGNRSGTVYNINLANDRLYIQVSWETFCAIFGGRDDATALGDTVSMSVGSVTYETTNPSPVPFTVPTLDG